MLELLTKFGNFSTTSEILFMDFGYNIRPYSMLQSDWLRMYISL